MTQRFNFTKAAIDALPLPEPGKRARYFDTDTKGLVLRVTPAGGKYFYLYKKDKGRPVEVKLGPYPETKIQDARHRVMEARIASHNQGDPVRAARRSRHEMTFGELGTWWLKDMEKRKKSIRNDKSLLEGWLARFKNRSLSSITRAELRRLHDDMSIKQEGGEGGIYTANKAIRLVRAMYNRAKRHDLFDGENPAIGVELNRERSRDRRLTLNELPAFFDALQDEPNEDIRDYVLLSLYTGARQANVLAMRWEQLDLEARTWRIPETKNGLPQVLPLEEAELVILKRRKAAAESVQEDEKGSTPWVFPSRRASQAGHLVEPKSGWRRILDRAGIKDLRIHDLRRTLGSFMVDTGASLHVVGKALGHQSSAATQIYARLSLDPVREAKARALGVIAHAAARPQN